MKFPGQDLSNMDFTSTEIEYHGQREMAIDCPDGFIPEFKTKPSLPNLINHQLNQKSNKKTSISSNESTKSKSKKNFINKKNIITTINPVSSHLDDDVFRNERPPSYKSENLNEQDFLFHSSKYMGEINPSFELTDEEKLSSNSHNSKKDESSDVFMSNQTSQTSLVKSECSSNNKIQSSSETSIQRNEIRTQISDYSKTVLTTKLSLNENDLDKLLKTCNNDFNLLNQILNSNEFLSKVNLCKSLISTNKNIDLFQELTNLNNNNVNNNKHIYENESVFQSIETTRKEIEDDSNEFLLSSNLNRTDSILKKDEFYDKHDESELIIKKEFNDKLDNEDVLTDEGKYLLKKAQYYNVDNLKLVNIEKSDDPLGATIKNQDGSILISRIVIGGAAQKSGLLHEGDEILEINLIPVRGKTINDVCDMLCHLQGMISFLIIPNMTHETANIEKLALDQKILNSPNLFHYRALYNYSPQEDLYIPCRELGLSFSKGDILHVTSKEDEDWWQAYIDDDKDQSMAGLIPSQSFQQRRFTQMQAIIGDSFMNRKKREKGFCVSGINRRRKILYGLDVTKKNEEIVTYEEVTLYKPPNNYKRPIVLIGPHNIGRHELRKRLMQANPSLFEVAVPHTTRPPRRDEVDGKDYHFLPRHIFEVDIKQGRFVEHGEYDKNLYGTSREAIKKVIENSKICILNLYPQALKNLRCPEIKPFVIYIGPPNLIKLKELKTNLNESFKESDLLDIIDRGREIEELYGHFFDKIIRNTNMDKTYQELYDTIHKVQNEENWIPINWLTK